MIKAYQKGLAMVEMTVLLPLILLMFAGVAEFGKFIHDTSVVNSSLMEAGRYLTIRTGGGFKETAYLDEIKDIIYYDGNTMTDAHGNVFRKPRLANYSSAIVDFDCVNKASDTVIKCDEDPDNPYISLKINVSYKYEFATGDFTKNMFKWFGGTLSDIQIEKSIIVPAIADGS